MGAVEDLKAYQIAFELACEIHQLVKRFPKEERFLLTDQIRRSSRSVCANLTEGYRKRRYRKYFISKLTDAAGENAETSVWVDFCHTFEYIDQLTFARLKLKTDNISRLISYMMQHPEKFS